MRLYWYGFLMLCKKFIFRQNTGTVICDFAQHMGVVYIKVAQILAMQNVGSLFTEADRQKLSQICDHCNPIKFSEIKKLLIAEYGANYLHNFRSIDETPLGSASISQVHRAILRDGTEVVLKIKRRDVTRRIQKDIRQIRKFIHCFGRFAQFKNFFGSDRALECYVDWIMQETDFASEQQNILTYQNFARSVNGKVKAVSTKIVVPKLFPELCTDNIIVMEYIAHPTINHLPMTAENKQKVAQAENDYIKLSFYALFHDMPVVFHGDPHGGNIYLDSAGNLGFLDMGLIFSFSAEEAKMTRELFLNSYTGKVDRIIDLLATQSEYTTLDRTQLTIDMRAKIDQLHDMPVPQFFVEMIMVFTQYDIAVPDFLFKMAKAFLALFGLNTIMGNQVDTKTLLAEQVAEFYLTRTVDDVKGIFRSGLRLVPDFFQTSLRQGITHGLSSQLSSLAALSQQCQTTLQNCHEALELLTSKH